MILLFAVLAVVSAAFLLFRYSRQQAVGVPPQNLISDDPPPNAKPYFTPTEAELRLETAEKKARSIAKREYRARAEARAVVAEALLGWRVTPDRKHTAELLKAAAEQGLEGDYSRAAGEIVNIFHSSGIVGLTSRDLAALLDSHYRLLPGGEMSSGEHFWLKEEISRLSGKS